MSNHSAQPASSPPGRLGGEGSESGVNSAVERAGRLLAALGSGRPSLGLSLTEISGASGIHKTTVLRLLAGLERTGLVERDAHARYRIGLRLVELASSYVDDLDVVEQARPVLERLAAETRETVHLGVASGDEVIYVDKIESPQSLRMVSRIGSRNSLHCTALGKALLAWADESYVASLFSQTLEPRTPNTITDEKVLRAELAAIRVRGYSVDREENKLGICCVGAEVRDRRGRVTAAISISGPSVRMQEPVLQELGLLARRAASEISRRMGYVASSPTA